MHRTAILRFLFWIVISGTVICAGRRDLCPRCFNDKNTPRCVADDKISDVTDYRNCSSTKNCCWRSGVCYAAPRKGAKKDNIGRDKSDEEMLSDAKGIVKKSLSSARFLSIGPFDSLILPYGGEDPYSGFSKLPHFVCQKRPKFPDDCDVSNTKGIRYTRDPPLNIPYCLRIPCDPNRPQLENDQSQCRDTPGCFFDKTLSEYRQRFGHSVMPGVPVCHLAIRNSVFLEEANKVKKKAGSWSPVLTDCLLDTFKAVITYPKEGCRFLTMLKYFKHKPKLAGWKGINEYACWLLDACWVNGEGCFYPVDVDKLTVTSAPTTQEAMTSSLYYGRPPCQRFKDKTAKDAILSYHTCLISGCKLDQHAQNKYYNYLFEFGKTMSPPDHWVFWRMVESGKYGAHNLDEYNPLPKHDTTVTPFSLVISYTSNTYQTSIIDELKSGGSSSILDLLKSSSGLKLPPGHDTASDSFYNQLQNLQTPCSATFTSFGGRPCGPPAYEAKGIPDYCPYKPITATGLTPMTGSFAGCCDITLCYHPKDEVRKARSGASAYYSIWSYWTECSTTCGPGTKKRWRKCVGIDQSQCKGKTAEKASCEIAPCSSWGDWGLWSTCPATCDGGVRTRTRDCQPATGFCPGSGENVERCNTVPCRRGVRNKFGPWSEWEGSCEPCGQTIFRSRTCQIQPCTDDDLYESQGCSVVCGAPKWSDWSQFSTCVPDWFDFTGQRCIQSRTRNCVGGSSTEDCNGQSLETRDCNCPE